MKISDFDYELPRELIAQRPPAERSAGRLLRLDGAGGRLRDCHVRDLPELLSPGDLLVFNDTRVIPARLFGRKPSGGAVELLLERILAPDRVLAHARASKPLREGGRVLLAADIEARVLARRGELFELTLTGAPVDVVLGRYGHVPLPPYIERSAGRGDWRRYQTVFAREPGAVAAPTAGLHFDESLLRRLTAAGIGHCFITLHVGAGTFQPVRTEDVRAHHMHSEYARVDESICAAVARTRQAGGRVVAVGTTVVRSLESAAAAGELQPFVGETDLFIYPGFKFRAVDALITNFHLPRSSLLMLVAAFVGREPMLAAYGHAVRERYRFFSYGDAMLALPAPGVRIA
jgi:S-adenosylmethionine:tRNA ribosyltransferase-isomerase